MRSIPSRATLHEGSLGDGILGLRYDSTERNLSPMSDGKFEAEHANERYDAG
jgi:hypothetical protein